MTKPFMKSSTNYYYSLSIVHSNQHNSIILFSYKHVKIIMDDDTQKEKMIIPSFGGVEDFLQEDLTVFKLLDAKDSILVE